MNMENMMGVVCPQCNLSSNPQNRIIIDSCGHQKCRQCFLQDDTQCQQCLQQPQPQQEQRVAAMEDKQNQNMEQVLPPATEATTKEVKRKNVRKSKPSAVAMTAALSHILEIKTDDGDIKYRCSICDKTFGSRTQRYYHLACSNEEQRKHKCQICYKAFVSRSHLNYHLESHAARCYTCAECGRQFNKMAILKKHLKTHCPKRIVCTLCSKEFRQQSSYNAHMAKHKNLLNFKCGICNTKYATKSALQQHELKHKERKYECQQCSKRFYRNSSLKVHQQRHSNATTFKCATCPKAYKDATALLRHAKTHTADKIYKCKECDTSSFRKDNMLRHIKNMHNGSNLQSCLELQSKLKPPLPTVNYQPRSQVEEKLKEQFDQLTNYKHHHPQTVQNSTVIKCVGNVKPVVVPQNVSANSAILGQSTFHMTKESIEAAIVPNSLPPPIKKYDPIEMYRKILNTTAADNEETPLKECAKQNEQALYKGNNRVELQLDNSNQQKQQLLKANTSTNTITYSNFSEMHWRKNFRFTYQHQD